MRLVRAAAAQVWGLFVDDGPYAAAILAWVLVATVAAPRLGLPSAIPPLLLFAGLAAILVSGARRAARRR